MDTSRKPSIKEALDLATTSIKQGNLAEGKAGLEWVIQQDPNSVLAWLWMTRCVSTRQEKLQCYRKVLAIDPSNEHALRGVTLLTEGKPSLGRSEGRRFPLWVIPLGLVVGACAMLGAALLFGLPYMQSLLGPTAPYSTSITQASNESAVANPAVPLARLPNTLAPTNTSGPTKTPRPTPTPRPTSTPEYGSISNPFPIGETTYWWQQIDGTKMDFAMRVLQVIRGPEAWDYIYAANMFNDEPPTGMEYILVSIEVDHTGRDSGAIQLNQFDFSIATKGQIFDSWDTVIVGLEDVGLTEFDFTLMSGAQANGWLAFPVFTDDSQPFLVYDLQTDGTGGYYFSVAIP